MLIARRRLLKAAIAAPFVLRSRDGFTRSLPGGVAGKQPPIYPTPAQLGVPAAAATFGFTNTVFYDNFSSLSTIDLTNSLVPGFNWYLGGSWPNSAAPVFRSLLAQDPTGITLNAAGQGVNLQKSGHYGLVTAAGTVGSPFWVGTTFYGGGYFECSMNYDPTLANTGDAVWPAFWSHELEDLINATPTTFFNSELDFYEAFPSSNGAITTLMGAHEQTYTSGVISADNALSAADSTVTFPGSPTLTQFHRYGTLWVPAVRNGGTGLVKRYFDGVELTGTNGEFTYSPTSGASPAWTPANYTGIFSQIDNRHMWVIVQSGPGTGWPVNVNRCFVVQ